MIKRSPIDTHKADLESSAVHHRRRSTPSVVPTVILIMISIGAFFVGAHLPHRARPRINVRRIDSAAVFVIETGETPDILIRTSDSRTLLITSDLSPSSIPPLIHHLNLLHIRSIDALIITSVSAAAADGITDLAKRLLPGAPVVTPYSSSDSEEWWSKTKVNFISEIYAKRLRPLTTQNASTYLAAAVPNLTIDLNEAQRSPWDPPVLSTRVTYKNSSLIDLCSLTDKQVAALTGDPGTGLSRLLFVNGQDQFVTKELLATVQPDIVVLTGSDSLPPGDNAEINIQAADAQAVTLDQSPYLQVTLPASDTEPLRSSTL